MITGVSLSVGEPYKKEMTYEFTRDFKVDTQPSGDCDGTSDYGAGRASAGLPCVTDWECKDAALGRFELSKGKRKLQHRQLDPRHAGHPGLGQVCVGAHGDAAAGHTLRPAGSECSKRAADSTACQGRELGC